MRWILPSILLLSLALFGCAGDGGTVASVSEGQEISGSEIPAEDLQIDMSEDGTALPETVPAGEISGNDITGADLSLDDIYIDLADDETALPEQVS